MDKRLKALQSWLIDELHLNLQHLDSASADASFRRYFRVVSDQGIFIAMDAPPDKEPIDDFVRINHALCKQHIHAPKIHQTDHQQGFILLEDFGDTVFLSQLDSNQLDNEICQALYNDALHSLIKLQQGVSQQPNFTLPNYSADLLQQEMQLFDTWYVQRHLEKILNSQQHSSLLEIQTMLINACLEQPQVWVHRDYHSRNLMVTEDHSPGVLDFQDMVLGPITYDLASLFKDCYIEWPRQQQLNWLEHYHQLARSELNDITFDFEQLIRWYDLTGLQRHLKVLGIFCRLNYRDDKPVYLNDLPLVTNYVLEVCDIYSELNALKQLLTDLQQA